MTNDAIAHEVIDTPLESQIKSFRTPLERDKSIISRYKEGLRLKDIAIEFDISEVRVSQIVKANHALITIDREMEKVRRYRRLKQCELKGSKLIAPKDASELVKVMEAQRKELEGDGNQSSINANTINIQINNNGTQSEMWEQARKLLGI